MPSRLSSLLVRDGLVGVKRMEKAFQRQVIYGGSLDTILLEMSLVPEERLTQYLALASGLPPAARAEGTTIDASAVQVIARELAEQYRAVPLAVEGDTVRVLVCAPLEINELEDLADQLDRPLQPLITPEYRWHLVFAAAYQLDPPARFTTLARSLDVDPVPPVGRAKTVIVDASAPPLGGGDARAPTPVSRVITQPMPAAVVAPPPPPPPPTPPTPPPMPTPTAVPIAPIAAAPTEPLIAPRVATPPVPAPVTPPAAPAAPVVTFGDSLPPADSGRMRRPSPSPDRMRRSSPGLKPMRRSPTTPIVTEGRDGPLSIVRAREQLAIADDRDTVFLTMLRAARSRARWAGLLTVQGGAAIGRVALAELGIDSTAINTVLIPLDAVSPFRTVVGNHQPHVGPLISGDPGIDSMILRMGGTMPPSALILPIVIRDRVVALVVAHRVHSDLRLADVTELLPLANAASEAVGRLIVKHKAAGYRAPASAAPQIAFEPEDVDTKRMTRSDPAWTVPAQTPAVAPFGGSIDDSLEVSMTVEPARPIAVLLDAIENGREGAVDDAIAEAVERDAETLKELMKRFPGKLRVDRFAIGGRPQRAAQYGGLLELVIQLGTVASELLIDKMAAGQRDVRFYATVCAAELRPRNAVFALAERLFDQDFGVRAAAIEALSGYPVEDLGHALVRTRRAVHSSDAEVVAAASAAIVELGDTDAIPDLIGVIERNDRSGEHSRRALIALTAQDFGTNERRWRKWYETARKRHRVEWLIESLGHKDDAIRETAIKDLRRLTGEYFGYHHDLPRKERDSAALKWAAWWRDSGHRRFSLADDERQRPTATLPSRRDS